MFTKRILGCAKLSYEERLTKLKLPSLSYRRLQGDMIEAFKIAHNIYDPVTTSSLLNFADSNNTTRSNGY